MVGFTAEDGRRVTARILDYSGPHRPGDTLRVRYVPPDPRTVLEADEPVARPVVLVVGGLFLLVGLAMAAYARRPRRR